MESSANEKAIVTVIGVCPVMPVFVRFLRLGWKIAHKGVAL
jgi:hypothetical protein